MLYLMNYTTIRVPEGMQDFAKLAWHYIGDAV